MAASGNITISAGTPGSAALAGISDQYVNSVSGEQLASGLDEMLKSGEGLFIDYTDKLQNRLKEFKGVAKTLDKTKEITDMIVNVVGNPLLTKTISIASILPGNVTYTPSIGNRMSGLFNSYKQTSKALLLKQKDLANLSAYDELANPNMVDTMVESLKNAVIDVAISMIDERLVKETGFSVSELAPLYATVRSLTEPMIYYNDLMKEGYVVDVSIANPLKIAQQAFLNWFNGLTNVLWNCMIVMILRNQFETIKKIIEEFRNISFKDLDRKIRNVEDMIGYLEMLGVGNNVPDIDISGLIDNVKSEFKDLKENFKDMLETANGNMKGILQNAYHETMDTLVNSGKAAAGQFITGMMNGSGVSISKAYTMEVTDYDKHIITITINEDPTKHETLKELNNIFEKSGIFSSSDVKGILTLCIDLWVLGKEENKSQEEKIRVITKETPAKSFTIIIKAVVRGGERARAQTEPDTFAFPIDLLNTGITEYQTEDPTSKKRSVIPIIQIAMGILKSLVPQLKILSHLVSNYRINKAKTEEIANLNTGMFGRMTSAGQGLDQALLLSPNANFWSVRNEAGASALIRTMGWVNKWLDSGMKIGDFLKAEIRDPYVKLAKGQTEKFKEELINAGVPEEDVHRYFSSGVESALAIQIDGEENGKISDLERIDYHVSDNSFSYVKTTEKNKDLPRYPSEILDAMSKGKRSLDGVYDDYGIFSSNNQNEEGDEYIEPEDGFGISYVDILEEALNFSDTTEEQKKEIEEELAAIREDIRMWDVHQQVLDDTVNNLMVYTDETPDGPQAIDIEKINACTINNDDLDVAYPIPSNPIRDMNDVGAYIDSPEFLGNTNIGNHAIIEFARDHIAGDGVEYSIGVKPGQTVASGMNLGTVVQKGENRLLKSIFTYGKVRETTDGELGRLFPHSNCNRHFIIDDYETSSDIQVDVSTLEEIADDLKTSNKVYEFMKDNLCYSIMPDILLRRKKYKALGGILGYLRHPDGREIYAEYKERVDKTIENLYKDIDININVDSIKATNGNPTKLEGLSNQALDIREEFMDGTHDWGRKKNGLIDLYEYKDKLDECADVYNPDDIRWLGVDYYLDLIGRIDMKQDFNISEKYYDILSYIITRRNSVEWREIDKIVDVIKEKVYTFVNKTLHPDILKEMSTKFIEVPEIIDVFNYFREVSKSDNTKFVPLQNAAANLYVYYRKNIDFVPNGKWVEKNINEDDSSLEYMDGTIENLKVKLINRLPEIVDTEIKYPDALGHLEEHFFGIKRLTLDEVYRYITDIMIEWKPVISTDPETGTPSVTQSEPSNSALIYEISRLYVYYHNNIDSEKTGDWVDYDVLPEIDLFDNKSGIWKLVESERKLLNDFWSDVINQYREKYNTRKCLDCIRNMRFDNAEWPTVRQLTIDGVRYDWYFFENIKPESEYEDWNEDWSDPNIINDVTPEPPDSVDATEEDARKALDDHSQEGLPKMTPAPVDITKYKYWLRYFSMMTLVNCAPMYWSTGMVLAGVPIKGPAIFIPVSVIFIKKTNMVMVFGISYRIPLWFDAIILYVNLGQDTSTILQPLLVALNMVKESFGLKVGQIENTIPNVIQTYINTLKQSNDDLEKQNIELKEVTLPLLSSVSFPKGEAVKNEVLSKIWKLDTRQNILRLEDVYREIISAETEESKEETDEGPKEETEIETDETNKEDIKEK